LSDVPQTKDDSTGTMNGLKTSLIGNFAPIFCPDKQITATVLRFEDSKQLETLRDEHRSTHLFRRNGDNIHCIALDGGDPEIGENAFSLNLQHEPGWVANLCRTALIDFYSRNDREILDFDPLEVVRKGDGLNLLPRLISEPIPNWLTIKQVCQIQCRIIYPDDKPVLVLVANSLIRKRFHASCDELLKAGLDLTGLFVGNRQDDRDPRISPRLRKVGKVQQTDGIVLHLCETRQSDASVNADASYLIADSDSLARVFNFSFKARGRFLQDKLRDSLATLGQGQAKRETIEKYFGHLRGLDLEILPGIKFQLGRMLGDGDRCFPSVSPLQEPTYIFDPGRKKTNASKNQGLMAFGPYTGLTFQPKVPRVCVVCEASRKGEVEVFIKKFLEGCNDAGLPYPPFERGFCRLYHLGKIVPQFFTTSSPSAAAYKKAVDEAIDALQNDEKWDLALVQSSEDSYGMPPRENAYLVTKAAFMTQQIPVQEFEWETMNLNPGNLEYALSNMALASYAKMSGVPWLITSREPVAHEFVVGLGSAFVGDGIHQDRERVVGITSVFSGEGKYYLSSLTKAVPIEEFEDALVETLDAAFSKARNEVGWEKGETVRIVFHCFKPFKDREAKAVNRLRDKLTDFNVECAFVHVISSHPWMLIDMAQHGVKAGYKIKGVNVPRRGLYLPLSKSECLITTTGPKELKKDTDGIPAPLLLRLHRDSNFTSMEYLAKQAFQFTSHSWRTFLPASLPVTIAYSELIARMLGDLSRLTKWSPDVLRGKLGRSRWFL
jgi:hypothetical protein